MAGPFWGLAASSLLPFLEGEQFTSNFYPDADWQCLILVSVVLEGSPALGILLFMLPDVPELVLGVDVIFPNVLGLGVRVEAIDFALPSTMLATSGALPDQVLSVGQS